MADKPIKSELEALAKNLSAKRMKPHEMAGHHFGKSGLAKKMRGESDKAPKEIRDQNRSYQDDSQ